MSEDVGDPVGEAVRKSSSFNSTTAVGEAVVKVAVVGEAVVKEAVVGEAVVGEAVVGEAVAGEAVVGEAVVGEAVGESTGIIVSHPQTTETSGASSVSIVSRLNNPHISASAGE